MIDEGVTVVLLAGGTLDVKAPLAEKIKKTLPSSDYVLHSLDDSTAISTLDYRPDLTILLVDLSLPKRFEAIISSLHARAIESTLFIFYVPAMKKKLVADAVLDVFLEIDPLYLRANLNTPQGISRCVASISQIMAIFMHKNVRATTSFLRSAAYQRTATTALIAPEDLSSVSLEES